MVQLSHPYMTTGKIIALTLQTFVSKVMSLFFNMLSRFVIAFLLRSKSLLILWLYSSSTVILEPKKRKPITISTLPFSVPWIYRTRCHDLCFLNVVFYQPFHSPLSPSLRGSLVPLRFLLLYWYHLYIWGCWYFSQQSWFQLVSHPAWHFAWFIL